VIVELTPEQEALIPVYADKWKMLALSTKGIERQKATEAIKATYSNFSLEEPEILFFDGPGDLYPFVLNQGKELGNQFRSKLWRVLDSQVRPQLHIELAAQVEDKLCSQLYKQLVNNFYYPLERQIYQKLNIKLCRKLGDKKWNQISRLVSGQLRIIEHSLLSSLCLDFFISVLNCTHDQRKWTAYKSLFQECGWIFAYTKFCLVCDRPKKLLFDKQKRLHGEGEAAILFADGYSLYSYHGVTLPKKYGKLHPSQWPTQWIFEEIDLRLRSVLIEAMGYDPNCPKLPKLEEYFG